MLEIINNFNRLPQHALFLGASGYIRRMMILYS